MPVRLPTRASDCRVAAAVAPDDFAAPAPLRVEHLTARPDGARVITSPVSALVVGAAPAGDVAALLDVDALRGPVSYVLIGGRDAAGLPFLRVGETQNLSRRLAEHRATVTFPVETVLVVGSSQWTSFGKDASVALEQALTLQAQRADRSRVVGVTPGRPWLARGGAGTIARWLQDLRPMLVAAGCSLLESPGALLAPRVVVEHPAALGGVPNNAAVPAAAVPMPVASGYLTELPPGLLQSPGARHYALGHEGVTAQAVVVGPWTVLLAGSRAARADRSGIQLCLSRKRERMRADGLLRPAARRGLLTVTRDVALPSLTNAARVVTGTNLPGRELWAAAA